MALDGVKVVALNLTRCHDDDEGDDEGVGLMMKVMTPEAGCLRAVGDEEF